MLRYALYALCIARSKFRRRLLAIGCDTEFSTRKNVSTRTIESGYCKFKVQDSSKIDNFDFTPTVQNLQITVAIVPSLRTYFSAQLSTGTQLP